MVPTRKEPFTRRMLVNHVLGAPEDLPLGNRLVLQWETRLGRSLKAMTCLLAQTGFRKAEICLPKRNASRHFCLRGEHVSRHLVH